MQFILLVFIIQCDDPYSGETVDIQDQHFLKLLIEDGVDKNKDGQISYPEAEAVTDLYVSSYGLEKTSNLTTSGRF